MSPSDSKRWLSTRIRERWDSVADFAGDIGVSYGQARNLWHGRTDTSGHKMLLLVYLLDVDPRPWVARTLESST